MAVVSIGLTFGCHESPSTGIPSVERAANGLLLADARPSFSIDLSRENLNVCERKVAGYTLAGSFKSWSTSSRFSVQVPYASKDTVLSRQTALAFDRTKRRATQQIDCVLNEGDATNTFMKTWATRVSTGTSGIHGALLAAAFAGDIWCVYHFDDNPEPVNESETTGMRV